MRVYYAQAKIVRRMLARDTNARLEVDGSGCLLLRTPLAIDVVDLALNHRRHIELPSTARHNVQHFNPTAGEVAIVDAPAVIRMKITRD
jgi:hypothetical protein